MNSRTGSWAINASCGGIPVGAERLVLFLRRGPRTAAACLQKKLSGAPAGIPPLYRLGPVTLLELLAGPTPAGVIPADVSLPLVLNHRLDRLRRRRPVAAAVRAGAAFGHRDTAASARGDFGQGGRLRVGRVARVVERGRPAAVAGERAVAQLRGVDFDFGVEDELAEFLPDRVHQLLEH